MLRGYPRPRCLLYTFFNMYSIFILTLVSHFEDHDQNKTYNNLEYSLNLHRDSVGIRDTMYRFCQFQEILQRPLGQCAGGNVGKACWKSWAKKLGISWFPVSRFWGGSMSRGKLANSAALMEVPMCQQFLVPMWIQNILLMEEILRQLIW